MPDTKETREKKGRVKERQLLEADIEEAVDVVEAPDAFEGPEEDEEELEFTFEE